MSTLANGRNRLRFRHRKLPQERLDSLRKVKAGLFKAHSPLPGPLYIYLPRNERFVAIKAPLSYLTPQELARYSASQDFYLTAFVESVLPFQKAGTALKKILSLKQKQKIKTNRGYPEELIIPICATDLADTALKTLAPLWGTDMKIEPYFLFFFAEALCGELPPEALDLLHEEDVNRFETHLMRAGAAVFFAIHLGWTDIKRLTSLRNAAFAASHGPMGLEAHEILATLAQWIPEDGIAPITLESIRSTNNRVSQKISGRLERIATQLIPTEFSSFSIFGDEGICDE